MIYRLLQIVVFSTSLGLCGCSKSPLTDEQYLASWRERESDLAILHEGGSWHFDFQTVRLFRLNWHEEHAEGGIWLGPHLNDTRMPVDGIKLSDSQIRLLEAAVTGTHTAQSVAACFYPHHAFVFYDADDEIVGTIDVCFLCRNLYGTPKGYAGSWDLLSIAELIHDAGVPLRNPDWE